MDGGIDKQGRTTNKLSDRGIRAFVAKARLGTAPTKKLSDGGGLRIELTPAGTAVWRIKYRYGTPPRERLFAAGIYPEISLEAARVEREFVRSQLREGRDPQSTRQLIRAAAHASSASTFRGACEYWLAKRQSDWSPIHFEKSSRALERDVLPVLGSLPTAQITSAMIAPVIEKVARRGSIDTASKILQHVTGIFNLAKAAGQCTDNPAVAVREVLPRRRVGGRQPALLEITKLRDLLRSADVAPISPPVRLAIRLCAFTACRIGNVVRAQWRHFELNTDSPRWVIPRSEMKSRDRFHDHTVLLGPTIARELRAWRASIGAQAYVFPSPAGGAFLSREGPEKALRVTLGMGRIHTLHGFRAAFSTLARESGEFEKDIVELALDHVSDTETVRAYDRGERLARRRQLMDWWDRSLGGEP